MTLTAAIAAETNTMQDRMKLMFGESRIEGFPYKSDWGTTITHSEVRAFVQTTSAKIRTMPRGGPVADYFNALKSVQHLACAAAIARDFPETSAVTLLTNPRAADTFRRAYRHGRDIGIQATINTAIMPRPLGKVDPAMTRHLATMKPLSASLVGNIMTKATTGSFVHHEQPEATHTSVPTVDAIAAFNAAVVEELKRTPDQQRAIANVVRGNEQLYADYRTALRGGNRPPVTPKAVATSPDGEDAEAKWDAAVMLAAATSRTRDEATAKADRDNPGLRERMLRAYNARAQR
jgi:hypothetical protein